MARRLAVVISQAAGLRGMPESRPLRQCRDQRVLRQVLGQPDVADDPDQRGDQPGRLQAPDGLDGRRRIRAAGCSDRSRATIRAPGARQRANATVGSGGPASPVSRNSWRISQLPSQPGQLSRWICSNRRPSSMASSLDRTSVTA